MNDPIPSSHVDLLKPEKRAFAHLAVVDSRGEPRVTPMWFDYDGEYVIFNTARGRVKDRVLHKHPVVAFDVQDPANPYRYIQVRGPVVSESEEGAYDQISQLNQNTTATPIIPNVRVRCA